MHKHSYIGLDIVQDSTTYKVSIGQSGYRRDVLNRFAHLLQNGRHDGRVPCGPEITEKDPPDSPPADRSVYMSIIMSVMFLARFTRPDLMFATTILSTYCHEPTAAHMNHAVRLLKYIDKSPDMVIVFKCTDSKPAIYADASHATHHDGRGHGCLMIKMGSGIIYCKSYKLRLITLSSMESEYVLMCDAAVLADWLMSMLRFLRMRAQHIEVYQDNTSIISLSENDGGFARNKHLIIRRNKAKEAVMSGLIKVSYVPSDAMIADLGTKPLSLRMLLTHMHNAGMMRLYRDGNGYQLRKIDVPIAKSRRNAN